MNPFKLNRMNHEPFNRTLSLTGYYKSRVYFVGLYLKAQMESQNKLSTAKNSFQYSLV